MPKLEIQSVATIPSGQHAITTQDRSHKQMLVPSIYKLANMQPKSHQSYYSCSTSATAIIGNQQHLSTQTPASRCQSKCIFLKDSYRNPDGARHSSTGATQVQYQCTASSMAMQVQCRCKHKCNTSANAMETRRHMQTCTRPM